MKTVVGIASVAAASLLIAVVVATAGTARALLVGVDNQPFLAPGVELKGPANDVSRLRDFLIDRDLGGFRPENVKILCCGWTGNNAPTHANILAGLAALNDQSREGDFVYIHFSGYGAQQPASRDLEPDGLEEVLLPADAGPWSPDKTTIENALRKVELRAVLDALSKRGTFVLMTIDASFSPIDPIGAESGEVFRSIDPERLGLSPDEILAAAAPARRGLLRQMPALGLISADAGNVVVFTAAQGGEPTTEFEQDGVVQGLFTSALVNAWSVDPRATARRANERIINAYAASARRRPTPFLEGAADFAYAATPPIGSAQTSQEVQELDITLLVSLPQPLLGQKVLPVEVQDAIELVELQNGSGYIVKFVAAGEPADVRMAIIPDPGSSSDTNLWLLPPSGEIAREQGYRPPSLSISLDLAERLATRLSHMYRSAALGKIASLKWSDASDALGLSIETQIARVDSGEIEPVRPGEIPIVVPGDQLHIKIVNNSDKSFDINFVYLASDYSVTSMYANRIFPSIEIDEPLLEFNDESLGRESLAVIVTEAESRRPIPDLADFEQEVMASETLWDTSPLEALLRTALSGKGSHIVSVGTDIIKFETIALRQFDVLP